MLLTEIHSDADGDYQPSPAQRATLIAEAIRDRALWGVDRLGYTLRGVKDEITQIEQRNEGRLNAYMMERLAQETSPSLVRAVLTERPIAGHDSCRGGRWIRCGTSEYPCNGCWGCASEAGRAAWAISRFVWCMAVAPSHREAQVAIAGLEALAQVGLAFATLCGWFGAFAAMPAKLREDYHRVRLGHWYEVTGGRGGAAAHKGKTGRCVWTGISEGYGTVRASVETTSGDRFSVAASQLTRVEPDAFQAASAAAVDHARKVRKDEYASAVKCDAGKDGLVMIVAGPHLGKLGVVFWTGEKGGKVRLGVRELGTASSERYAKHGEVIREALWVDAAEARSVRQLTREQAEDAMVRLDAIIVAMTAVHPDFDRAMVELSGGAITANKVAKPRRGRRAS
jgi:hypothetical protein